jgi:hypothetical protein
VIDALLDQVAERTARATVKAGREELRLIVREELQAIFDARDTDQVGGLAELAKWTDRPSAEACKKAVARDPELAALATRCKATGHRRWRKAEVLGLIASRKAARR